MDKNEILEKSRKENNGKDEYHIALNKSVAKVGFITFGVLCIILITVEDVLLGNFNPAYTVLLSAVNFTIWFYKGIKLKDKTLIVFSIILFIVMVWSIAKYVMNLVG